MTVREEITPSRAVPEVWGDETDDRGAAVHSAARRITRPSDPKTTARPASELAAEAGPTITARRPRVRPRRCAIFEDVLAPATRAQDDPLNLAYIPARADQRGQGVRRDSEQLQHLRRHLGGRGRRDLRRERGDRLVDRTARLAGHSRRLFHVRRHHRQPVGAGRRAARTSGTEGGRDAAAGRSSARTRRTPRSSPPPG